MARDVNKATIIGRLGLDPEVRHAPSGDAVCNLSVATSESWKDKSSGETKSKTEWHRVVIWGKLAEVAAQYLKKGSQVYIEGKLETRKWTDNNGVERYTTEIKLDGFNGQMQMLGSKSDNAGVNPSNNQQSQPQAQQQSQGQTHQEGPVGKGGFNGFDEDIPF